MGKRGVQSQADPEPGGSSGRGHGVGSQGCWGSCTPQSCCLTLMLKAAQDSARTETCQAFSQRAAGHRASERGLSLRTALRCDCGGGVGGGSRGLGAMALAYRLGRVGFRRGSLRPGHVLGGRGEDEQGTTFHLCCELVSRSLPRCACLCLHVFSLPLTSLFFSFSFGSF